MQIRLDIDVYIQVVEIYLLLLYFYTNTDFDVLYMINLTRFPEYLPLIIIERKYEPMHSCSGCDNLTNWYTKICTNRMTRLV